VARSYHTLDSQASVSEEKLTSFLRKNGQELLPLVDLIRACFTNRFGLTSGTYV
jgi:hypothetical protein